MPSIPMSQRFQRLYNYFDAEGPNHKHIGKPDRFVTKAELRKASQDASLPAEVRELASLLAGQDNYQTLTCLKKEWARQTINDPWGRASLADILAASGAYSKDRYDTAQRTTLLGRLAKQARR